MSNKTLNGVIASWGVVVGKCKIFKQEKIEIEKTKIPENKIIEAIARFDEAIKKSKKQLQNLKQQVLEQFGEKQAEFIDTQLLVIQDPIFYVDTIDKIKKYKFNVEWIVHEELQTIADSFKSLKDPYMRERASDIYDIGNRILKNLINSDYDANQDTYHNKIVVAESLNPSETIKLANQNIKGIIAEKGSKTSHACIMAKSLKIPAMVNVASLLDNVSDGDTLILDAVKNKIIVNPVTKTIKKYQNFKLKFESVENKILKNKDLEAITTDGKKILLTANIGLTEEASTVNYYGGDGIGLLRTEFMYMNRVNMPLEDEQYFEYKNIVEQTYPNRVTIRTLDIGGDKLTSIRGISYVNTDNVLGIRGIRLSILELDYFKQQLKAILRASNHGKVQILLPMVCVVEELLKVRAFIDEIKYELTKQAVEFDDNVEVGSMIEVPSAVWSIDEIAKHSDFLSIGTNDLFQYTFALNRENSEYLKELNSRHPIILKSIKQVVDAANKYNKQVAVCGEMASSLINSFILTGLGVSELSMTPLNIPDIKLIIRHISYDKAVEMANVLLESKSIEETNLYIKEKVAKYIIKLIPEVKSIRDEKFL
jgi:phosphoenolpyruvate-protein phosphotransferase (PTS system enzyme I)